jgi:DNA polymerase III epsilon subunit-like protein
VGLVKFLDGKAADTFYSLIRPPSLYIRPDFTGIHGLTVDDVRDAPNFAEVWKNGILSFTAGLPLADARTCGTIACKAAEKYACAHLQNLLGAAGTKMKEL